jgi:hypothetical protein
MARKRGLLLGAAVIAALLGLGGVVTALAEGFSSGAQSVPPLPKASDFVTRVDNPWFPLKPGTTLKYRGVRDGKRAFEVLTVTNQTKKIQGVATTVVHDNLYLNGKLSEVTIDWYAQDKQGTVWYFGEDTKTLNGKGQVESRSGSFEAGVDGARAGIFMPGKPKLGQAFQQEYYKGQAEDHFQILSLQASVQVRGASSTRAMRTKEWTPLEPGVLDNKYYVRGIGTVKELAVKGGDEHLELVSVRRSG